MKDLKNILLIDDDVATNYFNEMVINTLDSKIKVDIAISGLEALNYITDMEHHKRGLIFLDLNMPKLNGWEFLERYNSFSEKIKNRFNIYILSSSTNNDDKDFALNHLDVKGYLNKPLTEDQLQQVIKEHFYDADAASA